MVNTCSIDPEKNPGCGSQAELVAIFLGLGHVVERGYMVGYIREVTSWWLNQPI